MREPQHEPRQRQQHADRRGTARAHAKAKIAADRARRAARRAARYGYLNYSYTRSSSAYAKPWKPRFIGWSGWRTSKGAG